MASSRRYGNDLDDAAWSGLLEAASRGDWEHAASDAMQGKALLWQVAHDPCRHDWIRLAGLTAGCHVLEVGPGYGGLTVALANEGCRVTGVDVSADRLALLRLRLAQSAGASERPVLVQGDVLDLPFDPESFDAVILVGVLEWVAVGWRETEPAEDVQAAALQSVARVLRRGGRVYVAIENRRGAKYEAGADEDHSGVPGLGAATEEEADRLCRLWTGQPYRCRTHTWEGYRKLFSRAGLEVRRTWLPLPDYKLCKAVVTASDEAVAAIRNLCGEFAADPYVDPFTRLGCVACARAETAEDLLRAATCFLFELEPS